MDGVMNRQTRSIPRRFSVVFRRVTVCQKCTCRRRFALSGELSEGKIALSWSLVPCVYVWWWFDKSNLQGCALWKGTFYYWFASVWLRWFLLSRPGEASPYAHSIPESLTPDINGNTAALLAALGVTIVTHLRKHKMRLLSNLEWKGQRSQAVSMSSRLPFPAVKRIFIAME